MRARLQDWLLAAMRYPPPPAMTVDNVHGYLDALYQRRDLEGPVVEVGCARGGSTVVACRFLSRIGRPKPYYCIDTFGGFVEEQLASDHRLGLPRGHDRLFRDNSRQRVARTLARLEVRNNIHLVEADICTMDDNRIPEDISVALLDVDLRDPILAGLRKLYPKLAGGGVILVDDCKAGTSWVGADVGYRDFVTEAGLEPAYFLGFGVVVKEDPAVPPLSWPLSSTPNPVPPNGYA